VPVWGTFPDRTSGAGWSGPKRIVQPHAPPPDTELSRMDESKQQAWDEYWARARPPLGARPGGFTRWASDILLGHSVRRVVDLGCGPGRDLCFLVTRGFEVRGVDSSSVAVGMAETAIAGLPPHLAARASVECLTASELLERIPPGSIDGVHATVLYETIDEARLPTLFALVRAALRPGGLHVWSARTFRQGAEGDDAAIPPNRPESIVVHHRPFTLSLADDLSRPGYDRIASASSRDGTYLYVADQRPVD